MFPSFPAKMYNFLMPQEKIIDELGTEMDSTSNRLDFVQVTVLM